jgi:tRNA A58 N-methylase Trm61
MGLKVVDLVKSIVAGVVSEGDTVVDATVGNGNDTIFLARLVGEKGRVYGLIYSRKLLTIPRDF